MPTNPQPQPALFDSDDSDLAERYERLNRDHSQLNDRYMRMLTEQGQEQRAWMQMAREQGLETAAWAQTRVEPDLFKVVWRAIQELGQPGCAPWLTKAVLEEGLKVARAEREKAVVDLKAQIAAVLSDARSNRALAQSGVSGVL